MVWYSTKTKPEPLPVEEAKIIEEMPARIVMDKPDLEYLKQVIQSQKNDWRNKETCCWNR